MGGGGGEGEREEGEKIEGFHISGLVEVGRWRIDA